MKELEESRTCDGAPGLFDPINNNALGSFTSGVALHRRDTLGGAEYASTPLRHDVGTRESSRINGENMG